MTLFLSITKDFLTQNVRHIIKNSEESDSRSATFGALLGKRDLTLSAEKRTALSHLISAIDGITIADDTSNQTACLACIETAETSLQTIRSTGNHAPASTEDNLLRLKACINKFYQKLDSLQLLEQNSPQIPDPVFHLYYAIASYFADRSFEGAIKTDIVHTTLQWFNDHPSISYKRAFLLTIDSMVEERLLRFQRNLAGQKTKEVEYQQRKLEAVQDCIKLLRLEHEELRLSEQYCNHLGQPLSVNFLVFYLNQAKTAIELDDLSSEDVLGEALEKNTI